MSLSLVDHHENLAIFADRVPELLMRHGATMSLAGDFKALQLGAQLSRREFSLAIIGRMKAGKSTLINALVGDSVAPVGINETTATVNWIEHGDEKGHFEIHWRDTARPMERRSADELEALIGRSEEAANVDHLRFMCPSEFLRGVRLIDAPGTMSMIDSHEAHAVDLVTRRYGERADAVILALPITAMESDAKLADQFAEQTRIPGQGAYNTIAVMQKWESLDDPVPEEAAVRLAANFRDRLQQHVADVLPVSGLLAIFADKSSEADLDAVAHLALHSDEQALATLLKMEARFRQEIEGIALSVAARENLFESLKGTLLGRNGSRAAGTFEAIRFAIRFARRRGLGTGVALRAGLIEVSGLDQLRNLLERRFFATASLIRSGSVLRKALEPCRTAAIRLRGAQAKREQLIAEGEALLKRSDGPAEHLEHIAATLAILGGERDPIDHTARELHMLVATAERDFRMLMDDIAHLAALTDDSRLPEHLQQAARRLFGQFGCERVTRLGLAASASAIEQHQAANRMFNDFFPARTSNRIARHADARLLLILEQLDAELAE